MNGKRRGFTLIEVMIVVVIIGIAITFTGLGAINYLRLRRLQTNAEHLQGLLPAAQLRAILQPTLIGIQFSAHGYKFLQWITDQDHPQGYWQLLNSLRIFMPYQADSGTQFTMMPSSATQLLSSDDIIHKNDNNPDVIFFSSGSLTPFTLQISNPQQSEKYQLAGEASGEITLTELKDGA